MRLLQFFAGHDAMYVLFFLASKELLPSIVTAFLFLFFIFIHHCGFCRYDSCSAAGFEPLGCRLVVTVHTGGVLLYTL